MGAEDQWYFISLESKSLSIHLLLYSLIFAPTPPLSIQLPCAGLSRCVYLALFTACPASGMPKVKFRALGKGAAGGEATVLFHEGSDAMRHQTLTLQAARSIKPSGPRDTALAMGLLQVPIEVIIYVGEFLVEIMSRHRELRLFLVSNISC
ncbi:hypothetical protein BgiBS90_008294 [Biomphalaria glabrata]|nr:hypothetical protein BgiBS90_008294 [Biomphalaria glabrata]